MTNAVTIYFIKKDNSWELRSSSLKGHAFFCDFEFIKAILNEKQLKNIKEDGRPNQRYVSRNAFYEMIFLLRNSYTFDNIIDSSRYYIYSNIMEGARLDLDYPSFEKEELAQQWLDDNKDKISIWVRGIVKGERVLTTSSNCYVHKYFTKGQSEKGRQEILEKLQKIDKKIYKDDYQLHITKIGE